MSQTAVTSGRTGLFAEMLVVSLAVALLALPGLTALPALAAGCAHLRRHVEGSSDSLRYLWADFRRAVRHGWGWGALTAVTAAAAVTTFARADLEGMPGGGSAAWISAAVTVVAAIVLLRAAALWSPDQRWPDLIRAAAEATVRDLGGSALLLLALGLSFTIVWMFAPTVVLVPGMLVLAACAVVSRQRSPLH
ncbi:hypothetical protein [Kineosporia babensis]|uniref:Poxvirus protein I5 n=1 Tax=Kineosporia babensis TaxID=499548 RepID=A0A9X1NC58_9ACTN|nr:hypothetical protein [Kineosporia babensis]MCD5311044.1 hypothetical protein [Kineosporia babensis]